MNRRIRSKFRLFSEDTTDEQMKMTLRSHAQYILALLGILCFYNLHKATDNSDLNFRISLNQDSKNNQQENSKIVWTSKADIIQEKAYEKLLLQKTPKTMTFSYLNEIQKLLKEKHQTPRPQETITFVNVHNTHGDLINNMIHRFADKNNLPVGLPLFSEYEMACYPLKFKVDCVEPSMHEHSIMAGKLRFDAEEINSNTPYDNQVVIMLSDPVQQAINYFQENAEKGEFSFSFENLDPGQILLIMEKFYSKPSILFDPVNKLDHHRLKNPQAFDLGLNNLLEISNQKYKDYDQIQKSIIWLDKKIDFVLIFEHLEESLILLRHYQNWSWNDIIYLYRTRKTIQESEYLQKTVLPKSFPKLANKIYNWNSFDKILYNYYNQTLWTKLENLGFQNVYHDVQILHRKLRQTNKECFHGFQYSDDQGSEIVEIKKSVQEMSNLCQKLLFSDLEFNEYLREKMYSKGHFKYNYGILKPSEEKINLKKEMISSKMARAGHLPQSPLKKNIDYIRNSFLKDIRKNGLL